MDKKITEFVTTLIEENKIFKALSDNAELIFQAIKHGIFPLVEMPAEMVLYDTTTRKNYFTGGHYSPIEYYAQPVSATYDDKPYMSLDAFVKEIEAKGYKHVRGTTRFSIDGTEFQITWDYGDGDYIQYLVENAVKRVVKSEVWQKFYEEFATESDLQLGDRRFFNGTNIPRSAFTKEKGKFTYDEKIHFVIGGEIVASFSQEEVQLYECRSGGVVVNDILYWIEGGDVKEANFPVKEGDGNNIAYNTFEGFFITTDYKMFKVMKNADGNIEVISRQLSHSNREPIYIHTHGIYIVGSDVVSVDGRLIDFPELDEFLGLYFSKLAPAAPSILKLDRDNGCLSIANPSEMSILAKNLEDSLVFTIPQHFFFHHRYELKLTSLCEKKDGSEVVLNERNIAANLKKGVLIIEVPENLVGRVIGKSGKNIKSLTDHLADRGVKYIKVVGF